MVLTNGNTFNPYNASGWLFVIYSCVVESYRSFISLCGSFSPRCFKFQGLSRHEIPIPDIKIGLNQNSHIILKKWPC